MEVKIRNAIAFRDELMSLEDFFSQTLDGTDYDQGVMEDTKRTAENVAAALGRLCTVLAEKGILDVPDLNRITQSYRGSVLELEPDGGFPKTEWRVE